MYRMSGKYIVVICSTETFFLFDRMVLSYWHSFWNWSRFQIKINQSFICLNLFFLYSRSTIRPSAGPRYDTFPTAVTAVAVPRRSEQYTYDSYAGAAAAGTAHATGSAAFVASAATVPPSAAVVNEAFRMQAAAPQTIVSEPYRLQAAPAQTITSEPYRGQSVTSQTIVSEPFRLQSAAPQSIVTETYRLQAAAPQSLVSEPYRIQQAPAQTIISEPYRLQASQPTIVSEQYASQVTYPRVSANNDVFTRELLELYATNPAAFSLCAQNPAALRSMNANGQVAVVGMTDLPGSSYGLLQAQGDYFDKRITPRSVINIAYKCNWFVQLIALHQFGCLLINITLSCWSI